MKIPAIPVNEAERLRILHELEILDTDAEEALDELTKAASIICGCPIALVSLVDEKRQWFKSKVGLGAPETPRDMAFCAHAINEPDSLFTVVDSHEDERFHDNPLVVNAPHVRFYAGAPLVMDENRNAIGTLCVIDDKPHRALEPWQEEALKLLSNQVVRYCKERQERLHRFNALYGSIPHPVLVFSKERKLQFANKAWETKFPGLQDVTAFLSSLSTSQESGMEMSVMDYTSTTVPQIFELETKYMGDERTWELFVTPLMEKHGSDAYMFMFNDRTQHARDLVALRKAKERAQTADKAKSQFVATMSHEIRTPLNGIVGIVELLMQDEMKEEHISLIQTLSTSSDVLLSLINDVLDFAKIEDDSVELEEIPLSIRKLVEESCCLVADRAHQKGVDILSLVDPSIPDMIIGDPVRIRQILINLLGNSIKFTNEGSVIVRVTASSEGTVFEVKDTGCGIPPEVQQILFKPFTQADKTITRTHGGTGLGLAICASLAELMKGRIDLQSEVGVGTAFSLSIPQVPYDAAPRSIRFGDNIKVAVAVSDPLFQEHIIALTKSWSINSCSLTSLDPSSLHEADLLISDHDLPCDTLALTQAAQIRLVWCHTGLNQSNRDSPYLSTSPCNAEKRHADMDIEASSIPETTMLALQSGTGGNGIQDTPVRREAKVVEVIVPFREVALAEAISRSLELKLSSSVSIPHTKRLREPNLIVEGRVLVAEDNKVNQKVICAHLKRLGLTVTVCENGLEALNALKEGSYDIVLADCLMPVMTGYEFARAVRELTGPKSKTPIVALTANATPEDRTRCLESGMDAFLSKPIKHSGLVETLRGLMPCHGSGGHTPTASSPVLLEEKMEHSGRSAEV